jgi:glycerate 2-kinase
LRIVIAPDSFKDCLPAREVASAMAEGVRRIFPEAMIDSIPMADGGQGTVDAVLCATAGERRMVRVTGPLGSPIDASFALLSQGKMALMEMASASGLELVPIEKRNPLRTTTFGTGELLRAVLETGVEHILIGIGGSATNDGGIGLAMALGYRLKDDSGASVPLGGEGLFRLASIDSSSRHPRLSDVRIDVACDVVNPLTGPTGASVVYGPQKGATPEMVARLDEGMARLAKIVERDLGIEMDRPGAGAAGGLGGGLVAFAGATLRRGVEIVIHAVGLEERLVGADLCLTGEGRMDGQSSFGKTASGVADLGQKLGVPTVAIVGSRSGPTTLLHEAGMTAVFDITPGPMNLDQALADARNNIVDMAEQVARLFFAGTRQPKSRS